MSKDELHDLLISAGDNVTVPVADFIEVYGNDNVRKVGKKKVTRADILAKRYGFTVVKDGDDYNFTRIAA